MTPRTRAIVWRFLIGVAVVDLPILAQQLAQPTFEWRLLAAGLIGGMVTALEKMQAPQLADTLIPPAAEHNHPAA